MFVNKGRGTFSTWKSLLVFNKDRLCDSNKVFVNNLSCAASLGHCCIRREDLRQIGLIRFWKRACHRQVKSFWMHYFWSEGNVHFYLSNLSCVPGDVFSWICWVMHSFYLYILEGRLWVKVAETNFFFRRLGAPGDQQKSLQLQPQLSLQLDRCSLSSR